MGIINSFIQSLRIGKRYNHKNLAVYPVYGRADKDFAFITLDEAMTAGHVDVKEDDMATVPELVVINRSCYDLLIVQGEELIGAKQNRTVNATVVVPAESSIKIPVSCTEKGRWSEGRTGVYMHGVSKHHSISSVRSTITASVNMFLKLRGRHYSDQQKVWKDIDSKLKRLKVSSRTFAQADMYRNKDNDVNSYIDAFAVEPEQCGIVGEINQRLYCIDVFCQPEILKKLYKKLIRSLAMEALWWEGLKTTRDTDTKGFMQDINAATLSTHSAPGKGEHITIEGKLLNGMALSIDEKIVHLYGFRV